MLDLGIAIEAWEKLPDVLIHYSEKNWLVLIEAITGHSPIDEKRKSELKLLFQNSNMGLIFATAFLGYADLEKYFEMVACETVIWMADEPGHLMYLDRQIFGPYES